MGSFCPNHIKFLLKKYRRVISHDKLKSDAKFKEKLTCGFKYDMRNLVNFHPTTEKSGNFFQWALFVQNIEGLSYKNTKELSFMTLNSDTKFE